MSNSVKITIFIGYNNHYMKRNIYLLLLVAFSTFGYAQEVKTISQNPENMKEVNHLKELHDSEKPLSVKVLFKGEEGVTRSLQLQKNGLLPEHTTPTKAVLVCVNGKVHYEDENGYQVTLESGEIQFIEPDIKHWVKGLEDSQLLLIK